MPRVIIYGPGQFIKCRIRIPFEIRIFSKSSFMKKMVPAILIVVVAGVACSKSTGSDYTPDCTTSRSYSADVSPIIQSYCAVNSGCHATGSHNGPGALTSYQPVYNNRSAIRTAVANGSMPEGSSLTNAQKNAIICWIDNGAMDN
jgi:hypothetical protein